MTTKSSVKDSAVGSSGMAASERQGMVAVHMMEYLNQMLDPNYISMFASSTLTGNLPILVTEKRKDLAVEWRIHTALHSSLRLLAGSLGKMLQTDSLQAPGYDVKAILQEFKNEKVAYTRANYPQKMKALHETIFGAPDHSQVDVTDAVLPSCPYYFDLETLTQQIDAHYKANPSEDRSAYDALKKDGEAFAATDTKHDLTKALQAVTTYRLKGIDAPLMNTKGEKMASVAEWFFCAGEGAKTVKNSLKMPQSHVQVVSTPLGIGADILSRFYNHMQIDMQLQHPTITQQYKQAYEHAQNVIVSWADFSDIAACKDDNTKKVITLLNLKNQSGYDMIAQRKEAISAAPVMQENMTDMKGNAAAAAMGCPYHQKLLQQNKM